MTRLMVLGLLSHKPMSGYEMQQLLQQSRTDTWAGILPGSIYHALKKLAQEGFVRLDNVEQTGNRTKAIYSITEAGRDEMLILLRESLRQSSVVFPTELYTALSFIELLPREHAIAAIDEQIRRIRDDYEAAKAGEKAKEAAVRIPERIRLLFGNMYRQFELQLDFLEQLKEVIHGEEESK
ncbi:PadR family transcriptional regulator [Paenibacillus flagellatus]|uniref:PadR family transcriptional regulator n=2 Tax=Paenibacillus flagellatus TaxID=2211139 RepID=A0A2V5JV99_9BACL|nr:PadR family transcriptional regulator [Paenibacillus flagellatus]